MGQEEKNTDVSYFITKPLLAFPKKTTFIISSVKPVILRCITGSHLPWAVPHIILPSLVLYGSWW